MEAHRMEMKEIYMKNKPNQKDSPMTQWSNLSHRVQDASLVVMDEAHDELFQEHLFEVPEYLKALHLIYLIYRARRTFLARLDRHSDRRLLELLDYPIQDASNVLDYLTRLLTGHDIPGRRTRAHPRAHGTQRKGQHQA